MTIRLYITLTLVMIQQLSSAQIVTLLSENFNNGFPASWTRINNDGLIPAASVSFVNDAWVAYPDMDSTSIDDSLAVATSYYSPSGQADDWMITPPITLKARGNYISWQVKSQDPSYPDGYDVLVSTTLPVIDSFYTNDTIFFTDFEYAEWTNRSKSLDSFANQTIYLAFHAKSDDQYLLLIDNIVIWADTLTSTSEQLISHYGNVYPNPAKDKVYLEASEEISDYALYAIDGTLIDKKSIFRQREEINLQNFPQGAYLLQVRFRNKSTENFKIIKSE